MIIDFPYWSWSHSLYKCMYKSRMRANYIISLKKIIQNKFNLIEILGVILSYSTSKVERNDDEIMSHRDLEGKKED